MIWCSCTPDNPLSAVIILDAEASKKEELAAKELQRYIYLLTDTLPPIKRNLNQSYNSRNIFFVGMTNHNFIVEKGQKWNIERLLESLEKEEFLLKSHKSAEGKSILIAGGDDQGVLYGVYQFLEEQGIWFDLSGDIIPDEKRSCDFAEIDKTGKPVFEKRGLQPFHDFPEGPDYWDNDTYQAVISQLPKMKMNFLGFHTYPEGWVNGQAEPTVWIGLPEDVNDDGTVSFSYPSTFANTSRKHMPPLTGQLPWSYAPMATSDFVAGASMLFDKDAYGADFLNGHFPMPNTPEAMNEVFNNTGRMLHDAFSLAKELGVKTAIGTEIPITIPIRVKERMLEKGFDPQSEAGLKEIYKGIFKRIESTHPLDFYWLWTSESWLWEGHADEQQDEAIRQLKIIQEVWNEMKPNFKLATCGWTLGPPKSPTAFQQLLPEGSAMASINHMLGFAPVSPDFANVTTVDTWAIPWLEDDPGLCHPQLWAGRVRRDAADALHYGSEGLMGIHWRTRELSPQFGALARAGWSHDSWNPYLTDKALADKRPGEAGLARDLPIKDYYLDWCKTMFGKNVGEELATIFTTLDGGTGEDRKSRIPRPTNWDLGPGGVHITVKSEFELDSAYAFIDDMNSIRPQVRGNGNLDRFDFWLNSFQSAKDIAQIGLLRHQLNQKMEKLKNQSDSQTYVKESILPIRIALSRSWEAMITRQIERTSGYDVVGTICNLEQHSRKSKQFLSEHDSLILAILQQAMPPAVELSNKYIGKPRIIVPTVRNMAKIGEEVKLKVIIMNREVPVSAVLKTRKLTKGKFRKISLSHVARGVYSVTLPAMDKEGLEYYIETVVANGEKLVWPPTAPFVNQTIIPN